MMFADIRRSFIWMSNWRNAFRNHSHSDYKSSLDIASFQSAHIFSRFSQPTMHPIQGVRDNPTFKQKQRRPQTLSGSHLVCVYS